MLARVGFGTIKRPPPTVPCTGDCGTHSQFALLRNTRQTALRKHSHPLARSNLFVSPPSPNRTNLPKEIMAFPEFPWKGPSQSFVTHAQVLDYLYDYQQHFDLQKYIHTGCTVQHLKVLTTTGDNADQPVSCLSPETEHWPRIRLDWTIAESDGTAASVSREFDAVCVCNGHYGVPAVPELDGLKEHYKGRLMHSIAYDDPAVFAGQKVLCIGGRASGSDLAREIAVHADAVYLSDSVAPPMDETGTPVTKYNVAWVPKTTAVLADGSVQFDLGCNMNPVVDVIVFCTGYDYSFPFIDEETSNISLDFATGSRRVQPVLEQFWHAVNPNICFAGLPHSVLPFPLFELQMTAAVRQWQDWTLPTDKASRMVMAAKDAASGGEGMVNGRMPQDTHFLGPAQWDYCRRMAEYAGTYDDEMENYIATNKVSCRCVAAVLLLLCCL